MTLQLYTGTLSILIKISLHGAELHLRRVHIADSFFKVACFYGRADPMDQFFIFTLIHAHLSRAGRPLSCQLIATFSTYTVLPQVISIFQNSETANILMVTVYWTLNDAMSTPALSTLKQLR